MRGLFFFIFVIMIDIVRVYEAVRNIANRDQRGFVTPSVFNSFAQVAQENIYNEMYQELKAATTLRRSGRDGGRDKSAYKMIEEDLSDYIVNLRVVTDDPVMDVEFEEIAGAYVTTSIGHDLGEPFIFKTPLEMMYSISMNIDCSHTIVEMVYDSEKANRILSSNLSAPTLDFPVALFMGDEIQVFPCDVGGVLLRYYRRPFSRFPTSTTVTEIDGTTTTYNRGALDRESQPVYAALTLNNATGYIVPDLTACRHFDLPDHYMGELVAEICELVGLNLRDTTMMQYAMAQTKTD